jgi:hypothetical protein
MIFNRSNNGAEELMELTGSYYKSNGFSKVKVKVILASEDVANLIGTAIFTKAENHYLSENYMAIPEPEAEQSDSGSAGSGIPPVNYPLLDQLVQHIQLPISFLATLWHYQGNDISHEDTGRKMKIDAESEKMAWEWMYDRDDAAAMRNYQKTFDRLIRFLNANVASFPEWASSDARKNTLSLFINTPEHFDRLYPIDSSPVFYIRLAQIMREIERKLIKPILGDTYAELKRAIAAGTLSPDEQELYDYVCDPIPLLTMSKAITRLSVTLLPEGVVQNFISERQTAKASLPVIPEIIKMVSKNLWEDGLKTLDELKKFWKVYNVDPDDIDEDITDMLPGMDATDKFISL